MNRKYSLKKNRDFQYVYRAGKSCANRHMVIIYAKSRHGGVRVGFSVSKKVGNSVVRNRVKRRMKECFRQQIGALKRGYSIVFVARASVADEPYSTVERAMLALLKKAGLLEESK